MSELPSALRERDVQHETAAQLVAELEELISTNGYEVVEKNDAKPWGAYLRLAADDADRFVEDFFPGLDPTEARLGVEGAELSPKFLVVTPGQRLSWQYHDRRAERWCFLTQGAYRKSVTDDEGDRIVAEAGEVVQFVTGERHRLEGMPDSLVLVAEIWQHVDPQNPSNEDDIIRLSDDYKR
jgi:mannose-6-phosphate isomerase-like protein (cupin superfamily)